MNIYKLSIYNRIVNNLLEALNPEPFSEAGQNLAKLCLATKQKFSALNGGKDFWCYLRKSQKPFFYWTMLKIFNPHNSAVIFFSHTGCRYTKFDREMPETYGHVTGVVEKFWINVRSKSRCQNIKNGLNILFFGLFWPYWAAAKSRTLCVEHYAKHISVLAKFCNDFYAIFRGVRYGKNGQSLLHLYDALVWPFPK